MDIKLKKAWVLQLQSKKKKKKARLLKLGSPSYKMYMLFL